MNDSPGQEDDALYERLYQLNHAIECFEQEREQEPWETINSLLRDHPELIRTADQSGEYPLHKAASFNCVSAMFRLFEAGADVNVISENRFRQTPLHLAAQVGHPDIIEQLVKAGANLTLRAADGFTPLMEAIYSSDPNACVGALLRLARAVGLASGRLPPSVTHRQVNASR